MRNLKTHLIILRYKINLIFRPSLICYVRSLKIMDSLSTIDAIVEKKLSVSRFGDGEFYVMGGGRNGFQHADNILAEKLKLIFKEPLDNLLICIPESLRKFKGMRLESQDFALGFLLNNVKQIVLPFVPTNHTYGNSLFTRFYMMKKHKKFDNTYIESLKRIWAGGSILIIEGAGTRLGVGNDLLHDAKTINRILCPDTNAFDRYDDIYNAAVSRAKNYDLILISLGITATVLAYDLSKAGYQAVDIGHIDMEYEWMKMGATTKCKVGNKRMAEIAGGQNETNCNDQKYLSEIICAIE